MLDLCLCLSHALQLDARDLCLLQAPSHPATDTANRHWGHFAQGTPTNTFSSARKPLILLTKHTLAERFVHVMIHLWLLSCEKSSPVVLQTKVTAQGSSPV